MMSLSGKVSLVTGGAQGLGKAYTEALLKQGAKVCFLDIDEKQGETTLKELSDKYGKDRVKFVKCDVTSQGDMENAFRETKSTFGDIDLVCNNAGIADEWKWDEMIQTNLTSVVRGTILAIDYMSKLNGGKGGTVINVASIAGMVSTHHLPAYCATKHGVLGYTRSWAKNPNCQSMGLRFHALCPGFADTRMITNLSEKWYDSENLDEIMGHFGVLAPETLADAFITLAKSQDSTGEVLSVTGLTGVRREQEPAF